MICYSCDGSGYYAGGSIGDNCPRCKGVGVIHTIVTAELGEMVVLKCSFGGYIRGVVNDYGFDRVYVGAREDYVMYRDIVEAW